MPNPTKTVASAVSTTPLINRVRPGPRRSNCRTLLRAAFMAFLISLFYIFVVRDSPKKSQNSGDTGRVNGEYTLNLVAVGDLHGDYDNALKVLQMANVVDKNENWSGKVDYFVQTGDIVDRGLDTIKIYTWLENLRHQARNVGGDVFSHLGNHEYMNILGDWRYVPRAEIATFGGIEKRQAALASGAIGSAWSSNYTVVSRIPLHPISGIPNADYKASRSPSPFSHAALSFMHGGLSPGFTETYGTPYPSRINSIGATLLRRSQRRQPPPPPHPPAPYTGLPPGSTPEEAALYNAEGPLWYRGWAEHSEADVCSKVDGVMEKIGVRRLIMGHTPDFKQIVSRCRGKVIIIDTGISKAYGGRLSALGITYTLSPIAGTFSSTSSSDMDATVISNTTSPLNITATELEFTKKQNKGIGKWKERELVRAIYPDQELQLALDEREIEGDFW
ncbi:hypothetical protein M422DRAFT_26084 [Sphaerobolus stellatus SS14]|nr:hypothetical protein M422DRAFT_26084 [Sphaerobolus stellatus SS14]